MKLTSFTDYSLRVLIYLAAQPQRRATIAEIAHTFAIKENHLTKVVHFLGQNGWVATVRGKGGGLSLALPATQIPVGAVVRQTEGADVPAECFDTESDAGHGHCAIARICRLRAVLAEAAQAFHSVLDRYTVADLVHNAPAIQAMLALPVNRRPGATDPVTAG